MPRIPHSAPSLGSQKLHVKGFIDATEISLGGSIPSGNSALHVETSDTLSFSLAQEIIHGHLGSVDHKQKPLP